MSPTCMIGVRPLAPSFCAFSKALSMFSTSTYEAQCGGTFIFFISGVICIMPATPLP